MSADIVTLIGDIALVSVTALLWTFVVLYGVTARWEATEAGPGLLFISLISALILTLGCIRLAVASGPVLEVARTLLYLAALLALTRLILLFLRAQRVGKRPKE
ncbi:hypothetical protein BJF83_00990 [Nocardiopsis sp. CNR-923]|uniref:putative phage holin n=1 Tax=Nocardiopsis sp. CNR-923 TaxID=1904965 RepID=UPI00095B7FCA|nr:hypothetical protein [Nocardiopsis sp. CNR-923]OLT28104.1 hypothetical protein BJF83_00990 [Nocardiopsis sp. CNR-923]